jgi:hypothetical protein
MAQTIFTDVTDAAGVDVAPRQTFGNPIWSDFDGDGALDIFVGNHGGAPSLFRNNGNGTFSDRRAASGITARGDRHGAAWGDYDNDGRPDLFITLGAERGRSIGRKTDQLYRNVGNGRFVDVTSLAGVGNASGRGRSVSWLDFDNDGHLDLFLKNHKTANVLYRNNGNGTFTDVTGAAGLATAPGTIAGWADYDKDGFMDLVVTAPNGRDQLWRNNGNGSFTDMTVRAGLGAESNGVGIAWGDYDGDGWPDLYIARGEGAKNWMTSDHQRIVFSAEEVSKQNGLDFTTDGGAVTFDLFLDDCRRPTAVFFGRNEWSPAQLPVTVTGTEASRQPDYVVGTDLGFFIWKDAKGWHVRWSSNGRLDAEGGHSFDGVITPTGNVQSVRWLKAPPVAPFGGGTLYRNNRDGTFTDVTAGAGVMPGSNSRAAVWGDYDNDGRLDLYVVARSGPNHLFRNNGDGTFTDVAEPAGVTARTGSRGEGAAWGDFDADGFLDLYLTRVGPDILDVADRAASRVSGELACLPFGRHALYRNAGNGNAWLEIRLVGTASNRDGIGAKLTLWAGGRLQYREVVGGGGGQLFSQGSGPLHFGLGEAAVVDSLVIQWPSGQVDTLTDVAPDQELTITEGG